MVTFDWLRWGSATDTRSSNFEGHELRLGYAFGPSWNVLLRVYLVDAIEPGSAATVSKEDGKRARLDYNIAFYSGRGANTVDRRPRHAVAAQADDPLHGAPPRDQVVPDGAA